jgi:outer membrane receptor protein involved in Fe transport
MNNLKISLTIIILIFVQTISAQRPGGNGQARPDMKPGVVGKVVDSKTKNPVPYATVVLYKQGDSSMVDGTITKDNGQFYIPCGTGKYYIVVKFMGYDKYIASDLTMKAEGRMMRVGVIKLKRTSSELKGVEIVGQQSYVDYKIDRKVVNVGRDVGSAGGTAVEALENVPSVNVDIDGNVELRGSSSFTVLINGKPSPLNGSEALEQIPTSVIKNIEIITNPSAKYDPDGMTGIINVVLKEDVKQGLNGFVEASVASFNSYSLNTIFNYRKNKINYFVGANFSLRNMPGGGISDLHNIGGDTNMYRDTELDRLRKKNNYTLKGGMDYYLNDNNTFGIDVAYGINDFGKEYTSNIYERTIPSTYELYTISENTGGRKSDFIKTSINWEHKFKRKGEKIEAYMFFNSSDELKDEKQKELYSDYLWNDSGDLKDWYNTTDNSFKKDFRAKIDYTLKLKGDRKFEAGLQSRNLRENSEFIYNQFDSVSGNWIVRPEYGNNMTFNRDIVSAYSTYGGTYKDFGYQLGLRGEYTNRLITTSDKAPSTINRFDIFPTVHLSQKFLETNSIMMSYSRRIDRPGGWELGPNPIFISSNFIRIGNPDLEPEYSDNFELSYQKTIKKSFISTEAYYRTTKNKISRLQEMDDQNIIYMTYENLDRDHSAGMELMANLQLYKWLRFNISGNYYYYKLEGNITSGAVDQSSVNFDLRGEVNFMITPLMRFQINSFYRGPSVTAQGTMSEFYMVNSALRYDFFKRKMAVTFKVRDVFNTMRHEFETNTSTFTSYNSFNRQSPYFQLTVNYKINNYRQERKPNMDDRGGEGGDDI